MTSKETLLNKPGSPVGAGLLANASVQSISSSDETPLSRASSLPQVCGPTLDFAGVCLTLGRTTILDKVTFQVQPGNVHALVGPKTCRSWLASEGAVSFNECAD